ncbi:MAG: glycosyltransferase family 4 protein [Candidatus Ranarchaeia archaeon]|jgi:glycosyltransferase involved in cell wall biosynthesis
MNIFQVTNTFFPTIGGVEHIVDELAIQLTQQGHEVTTLVPSISKPLNLERPYQLEYFPGKKYYSKKNNPIWLAMIHLNTIPKIVSATRRKKPDLVNFHSRHFFTASRWIRKKTTTALTLQTTYFLHLNKRSWRKMLLESFDVVFAPTKQHMEFIRKLSNTRVEWVPTGINVNEFTPQHKSKSWRQALGIKPDEIVFLCVGRMVEYKGFTDMPAVIARLRKAGVPAKLVFLGDGPLRPTIEAEVKHLGIEDSVLFVGWVTSRQDLQTAYASTDIFVHPARVGEAYGRVIVEGLASGVPVLSTNTGGPADIITPEKDGLLAEPSDHESLYQAALRLAQNKSLREKLGKQGRGKAETVYSLDATMKRYQSIVESFKRD